MTRLLWDGPYMARVLPVAMTTALSPALLPTPRPDRGLGPQRPTSKLARAAPSGPAS